MMELNAKTIALAVCLLASLAFSQAGAWIEPEKVAVVHYKFTDSGLVQTNASVVDGFPPDLQDSGAFTASVLDSSGSLLDEFQFNDPRVYLGDEIGDNGLSGLTGVNPDAEFILIVPFNASLGKLVVSNTSTGQKLFENDLAPVAQDFCASSPQDAACAKSQPKAGSACGVFAALLLLAAVVFARKE